MKDASETPAFKAAIKEAKKQLPELADYISAIDPHICTSVTISTLHGCPPQEIESIASYLITEKKLHTLVKCNPTILGYDFARKRLDEAGFDYISFGDLHFREDLQYKDAVPMFHRLIQLAAENGVSFGLKLSNTCPVDVKAGELPSEEMYMSGKSLYLLTIEMAAWPRAWRRSSTGSFGCPSPAVRTPSTSRPCSGRASGPSPWPPPF